jgi:hypothetical protein
MKMGFKVSTPRGSQTDRAVRDLLDRSREADATTSLPRSLRARLERASGADLSEVSVHRGAHARALTRLLGTEAVTCGQDIFIDPAGYLPGNRDGEALLAHEVAHTLAPNSTVGMHGQGVIVDASAESERAADRLAARALAGSKAAPRPAANAGATPADQETVLLRPHASWEHRLLGDAPGADLNAIANNLPQRQQLLQDLRDFLYMWHQNPLSVTEAMIAQRYPYIRTVRLTASNLLVTYGELNTLPDYLSGPVAMDDLPANILLPILQAVRQEGYNRVQALLGGQTMTFQGSVAINSGWSIVDLLWETRAVDQLTTGLGPQGTDHYTALVGRNACHFAPYAWYRWQTFYMIARAEATNSYLAQDPVVKARLARQAWINLGYADHFLQDSFAAGHLVNKTLIMQWFIEWVADKWYVPVADWADVSTMTTARQPGIWAPQAYNMAAPGTTRDPQTAEEQPTLQQRMDTCGVAAEAGTQQAAYLRFISFLNSTVTQSSSGALHDYFNAQSVWAASVAFPKGFLLWGDDTMLNGGAGVEIADDTAHLSQQSIADILATGNTQITPATIFNRLPTQVSNNQQTPLAPIETWNLGLRNLAFEQFPAVHYYVLRAYPRIGQISIDQPAELVAALASHQAALVSATPPSATSAA